MDPAAMSVGIKKSGELILKIRLQSPHPLPCFIVLQKIPSND